MEIGIKLLILLMKNVILLKYNMVNSVVEDDIERLSFISINKNNLVKICYLCNLILKAGWQSGYAAACKAVYSGSIPDSASINIYGI